jgi:glycosyltransferase involved in cell wall biosynthesis
VLKPEKSLLIIGSASVGVSKIGGQTIKTRNIVSLLKERCPEEVNVSLFDTAQLNREKRLIFKLLRELVSSDIVIIIPAHESLKYIYPLVYLNSVVWGVPFVHVVVGGWLDRFIDSYPFYKRLLRRARVILTQSKALRDQLAGEHDLSNVSVLHNFKTLSEERQLSEAPVSSPSLLQIVHLARISESKGSHIVVEAGRKLMEAGYNRGEIKIDLYGPVSPDCEAEFTKLVDSVGICSYHGAVDPDQVNTVLSGYDCMLFPTTYPNEGFPGVILDAFVAGIPVIATSWRRIPEFIEDGENGFLVEPGSVVDICERIDYIASNREVLCNLKQGAAKSYDNYSDSKAWSIVSQYIK